MWCLPGGAIHLGKGVERHTVMPAESVVQVARQEPVVRLCVHLFSSPRGSRNFAARIILYALGKRRVHSNGSTLIFFVGKGKPNALSGISPGVSEMLRKNC